MKYEEINRQFTDTVSAYLADGYHINTGTMNGSQGEIAYVHLTDGNEIISVALRSFTESLWNYGVELAVLRSTDRIVPDSQGRGYIFWNSHADVVKSIRYYQIGSHSNHGGWYGTKADADAKAKTQKERFHSRCVGKIVYHDDARRKAVLPFIRRQQGCKTAKLSDIRDIAKCVSYHDGSIHYVVTARGKEFVLR